MKKEMNMFVTETTMLPGGGFYGGENQETLPGGGFHGGENQETLPGGGFHGGENQETLPGGGFHGGENQETLPGGGFHGGENQETLPGGGFHGGENQETLPGGGFHSGEEYNTLPGGSIDTFTYVHLPRHHTSAMTAPSPPNKSLTSSRNSYHESLPTCSMHLPGCGFHSDKHEILPGGGFHSIVCREATPGSTIYSMGNFSQDDAAKCTTTAEVNRNTGQQIPEELIPKIYGCGGEYAVIPPC